MPKSEINVLGLLGVLIAGGLAGRIAPGPWGAPLTGLTLLVLLFTYDREGYRTNGQSLAFGAVSGFCLMLAGTTLLEFLGLIGPSLGAVGAVLTTRPEAAPSLQQSAFFAPPFLYPALIWILGTVLFWTVDRSRMTARAQMINAQAFAAAAPETIAVQTPPPTPHVAESKPMPIAVPPPQPSPVLVRPSSPTSLFSQPSYSQQSYSQPPYSPPPAAEPVLAAVPQPEPPPPNSVPAPAGKPATIYLNLVGEGMAVLRSVQAEHLGKDYYRIVEPMPPGETWEFTTGQIVRCQKKNLSSGKAMVAVEEAPRAR